MHQVNVVYIFDTAVQENGEQGLSMTAIHC